MFQNTFWYYKCYDGEGSLWSWNCSSIVGDECGFKTLNNEEFN